MNEDEPQRAQDRLNQDLEYIPGSEPIILASLSPYLQQIVAEIYGDEPTNYHNPTSEQLTFSTQVLKAIKLFNPKLAENRKLANILQTDLAPVHAIVILSILASNAGVSIEGEDHQPINNYIFNKTVIDIPPSTRQPTPEELLSCLDLISAHTVIGIMVGNSS